MFKRLRTFVIILASLVIFPAHAYAADSPQDGGLRQLPEEKIIYLKDDNGGSRLPFFVKNANGVTVSHGPHYAYLTSVQKRLYDAIYIASKTYIRPYSAGVPGSMYLSDLQAQAYKFYTGNTVESHGSNDVNIAIQAISADHPDMVEVYMCWPYIYRVTENGYNTAYLMLYAMSDDNYFQYDSMISSKAKVIANHIKTLYTSDDKTKAAKILKAHDYYVTLMDYDYACAYATGNAAYFNLSHTAYGSLCRGSAVCDGYSKGFLAVLKELGFTDCYMITGNAGNSGSAGGHAWSMVKLDDNLYYEEDTTWADQESYINHDFFNRTTTEYSYGIGGAYHLRDSTFLGHLLPTATGTKYTYDYLQTTHDDETENSETILVTSLTASDYSVTVGQSITPVINVYPGNATNKTVELSTYNTDIVSISGGTVRGIKAGEAVILAEATDGSYKSTSFTVTVKESSSGSSGSSGSSSSSTGYAVGTRLIYNYSIYRVTGSDTIEYLTAPTFVKTISIPSRLLANGKIYTVTAISKNACKNNKVVTKLTIPNSVVSIGSNAFNGCENLKTVTINANIKLKVGSGAFKKLKKGSSIKIKGLSGSSKKTVVSRVKKSVTTSRTTVK